MGGGWGEDNVKLCRMCALQGAPLQAVPQLEGRVWWGPTLCREGRECAGEAWDQR